MPLRDLAPLRVLIGPDDVTEYVSDGWTFSNVDPGGYEAFSAQFPKDLPEILRGQYIRVDSGLRVAWEGRVSEVQRSLGHNTTIMGEGYGALTKDQAGSMIFIDQDLTQWQSPSPQRQINLIGAGAPIDGSSELAADPAGGNPGLYTYLTEPWVANTIGEAWYDAGPDNLIARFYYYIRGDGAISLSDTNWLVELFSSSDGVASAYSGPGNLRGGPYSGYFSPVEYRHGILQVSYALAVSSGSANEGVYWGPLAVYGNHGLTGRGPDPVGFYPSDIFGWVLSQTPGLQSGVIQATDSSGYIVPHYVQYTPVTLDTIASDMSTIQGWHWGVWESLGYLTGNQTPRADFRPRPAPGAFTASCRRSDCDTLDIREDLAQQFNQAVVTYTAVDGTNGAVTVKLDNPILDDAEISSRTVVFNGGTMTAATAAIFGLEALALTNEQARIAGSADIISPIDQNGPTPAWLLKAGIDRLRVTDVPSTDAWGGMSDFPITRVEASISSSGFNTSVELGSGADLIETLQARLAAATALAGQGGS